MGAFSLIVVINLLNRYGVANFAEIDKCEDASSSQEG